MNEDKNKELQEVGDDIHELLVKTPLKGKLPEKMFVAEFLPYFCGELIVEKESSVIPYWIGIAGSPTAEVDIIDPSGDTIFTVPPLFGTESVNVSNGNIRPIADIMTEYQQRSERFPEDAEKFLDASLEVDLSKPGIEIEVAGRWRDILQRYGKEFPVSASESETGNEEDSLKDDDLDYGD